MEVRAESDRERGPGHAILHVTGVKPLGAGADLAISIRRSSGRSLGVSGWQVTDAKLTPDSVEPLQDGMRILIGPDVVDHMEPLENYRLGLHPSDSATEYGAFVWRNIAQSPLAAKRKTLLENVDEPVEPEPAPGPVVEFEPESDPGPEPEPQREATFSMAEPEDQSKSKSRLRLLLTLLVVLLLVAGGLLLFWDDVTGLFGPDEPVTVEPGGPGDTDVTGPTERESVPQAMEAIDRARSALSGELSAEDALNLGREMYGPASDADAAFLLLEFAADMGNPEAALLTARFYDPTFEGPTGTIMVNPSMAREWYQAALDGGVSEAGDDMARLKAWVQAQAEAGDRDSRELLNTWQ